MDRFCWILWGSLGSAAGPLCSWKPPGSRRISPVLVRWVQTSRSASSHGLCQWIAPELQFWLGIWWSTTGFWRYSIFRHPEFHRVSIPNNHLMVDFLKAATSSHCHSSDLSHRACWHFAHPGQSAFLEGMPPWRSWICPIWPAVKGEIGWTCLNLSTVSFGFYAILPLYPAGGLSFSKVPFLGLWVIRPIITVFQSYPVDWVHLGGMTSAKQGETDEASG